MSTFNIPNALVNQTKTNAYSAGSQAGVKEAGKSGVDSSANIASDNSQSAVAEAAAAGAKAIKETAELNKINMQVTAELNKLNMIKDLANKASESVGTFGKDIGKV